MEKEKRNEIKIKADDKTDNCDICGEPLGKTYAVILPEVMDGSTITADIMCLGCADGFDVAPDYKLYVILGL